jgi:Rieske Fe-S protein
VGLRHQITAARPLELLDDAGRKVLLMEQPDGELLAISTVCTHLGCSVFFQETPGQFHCPCHNGLFDAQGNPVSGPPERPLPRYPVTVRDGKVFVLFA